MYLNYYGCVLLHLMSNVYQLKLKMTNICNKQKNQQTHDVCLEYSNSIIKKEKKEVNDAANPYSLFNRPSMLHIQFIL